MRRLPRFSFIHTACLILGLLPASMCLAIEDVETKIKALLLATNQSAIIQGMTPVERNDWCEALRSPAVKDIEGWRTQVLLLDLGDVATLQAVRMALEAPRYLTRAEAANHLKRSSNVAVIPTVANLLARDEPAKMVTYESEFFDFPPSVIAAEIMRRVLLNSPSVGDAVKQWARGYSFQEAARLQTDFRQWWEQNREHFAAQDYAAVKPLQTGTNVTSVARSPQPVTPSITSSGVPMPSSVSPKVSAPADSTRQEATASLDLPHWYWLVVGLTVVATAAGIVLMRKARSGPSR